MRLRAMIVALGAMALLAVWTGTPAAAREAGAKPTWTVSRSTARPAVIGRVIRGSSGDGEVEIRRAGRWSAPTALSVSGDQLNVTSVSCPTMRFCGAITTVLRPDGRPSTHAENYAFNYNGRVWRPSPITDGAPVAVDCPAAGTCLTVSAGGFGQLTFRGGAWETLRGAVLGLDAGDAHWRMACAGISYCVAVSDAGTSVAYTRGVWAPGASISTPDVRGESQDIYRGADLDTITGLACPAAGLCLAVGSRYSAPGHFGAFGFSTVLRDRRWSVPVRLPTGRKRELSVFCATGVRCSIPLTGTQVLTSGIWARTPARAQRLPTPPGLPTVSGVSLSGTEDAPTLAATIDAGAGAITSIEIYTDANEQIFGGGPGADTGAISITAGGQPVPYGPVIGGDVFEVTFPQPAASIALTVAPPEMSGPGVLGQPARTSETLSFAIQNTQGTSWTREQTVTLNG